MGGQQRRVDVRTRSGRTVPVKAPDITADTVAGTNRVELEVTNTWFKRLAGDIGKPEAQRITWPGAAGRGFGGGVPGAAGAATPPLLPAGLIGPVRVVSEVKVATLGVGSK